MKTYPLILLLALACAWAAAPPAHAQSVDPVPGAHQPARGHPAGDLRCPQARQQEVGGVVQVEHPRLGKQRGHGAQEQGTVAGDDGGHPDGGTFAQDALDQLDRPAALHLTQLVHEAVPPVQRQDDQVPRGGRVGLAPADEVERAVQAANLSAVQFHGEEGPAYMAAFQGHVKVIRATAFGPGVTPESFENYPADAVLLDARVPGSGRTFDWHEAAAWRAHPRMVLAGGLDPHNVAHAVAALRPYGVDVSSGVETAPGLKSADLIHGFVRSARAVPV